MLGGNIAGTNRVRAFKASLVGALRKCAGGTFLATDCSGYAARREVVWSVIVSDGHILFEWPKRIWKEKSTKEGARKAPSLETPSVRSEKELCAT